MAAEVADVPRDDVPSRKAGSGLRKADRLLRLKPRRGYARVSLEGIVVEELPAP